VSPATVDLEHLFRLSDDTGLLEHARGSVPRRAHGYCLDDVARGLVVLARHDGDRRQVAALTDVYLAFVGHAADDSGAFHNRLGYERVWRDRPGTGDWWGRALWGLGAVVDGHGTGRQRRTALDGFTLGCRQRSPWLRAMAFAALGAGRVLAAEPDHAGARAVLRDTVAMIGPARSGRWPWPEDRLAYADACIPDALITAGAALGDDGATEAGLSLLRWLTDRQLDAGHLSVVPVGGAGPDDCGPGFDQQPIEVAAVADAARTAFAVSGDPGWCAVIERAVAWFDGANDVGVAMHDPASGGGFDGLTATGPNLNQGAESTLAWLMTAQHGLAALPVPAAGVPGR
jgi:hypothetical protein